AADDGRDSGGGRFGRVRAAWSVAVTTRGSQTATATCGSNSRPMNTAIRTLAYGLTGLYLRHTFYVYTWRRGAHGEKEKGTPRNAPAESERAQGRAELPLVAHQNRARPSHSWRTHGNRGHRTGVGRCGVSPRAHGRRAERAGHRGHRGV